MSIVNIPEDPSLPSLFHDSTETLDKDDPWSLDLSQLAEEDSNGADSSIDPWELSPSPDSQTLFSTLQLPSHNEQPMDPLDQNGSHIGHNLVEGSAISTKNVSSVSLEGISTPNGDTTALPSESLLLQLDPCEAKIVLTVIPPEVLASAPNCHVPNGQPDAPLAEPDAPRPQMAASSSTEQELISVRVPLSPSNDCILITDSPSKVEKHFENRVSFSPSFPRFPSLILDSSSARLAPPLSPNVTNGHPPPLEPVFVPSPGPLDNGDHAPEIWLPPDNGIIPSNHTPGDWSDSRAAEVTADADSLTAQPNATEGNGVGSVARLPVEQDPELMKSFYSVGSLKRRNEGERQTTVTTMADIYPTTATVRKKVRKTGSLLLPRSVPGDLQPASPYMQKSVAASPSARLETNACVSSSSQSLGATPTSAQSKPFLQVRPTGFSHQRDSFQGNFGARSPSLPLPPSFPSYARTEISRSFSFNTPSSLSTTHSFSSTARSFSPATAFSSSTAHFLPPATAFSPRPTSSSASSLRMCSSFTSSSPFPTQSSTRSFRSVSVSCPANAPSLSPASSFPSSSFSSPSSSSSSSFSTQYTPSSGSSAPYCSGASRSALTSPPSFQFRPNFVAPTGRSLTPVAPLHTPATGSQSNFQKRHVPLNPQRSSGKSSINLLSNHSVNILPNVLHNRSGSSTAEVNLLNPRNSQQFVRPSSAGDTASRRNSGLVAGYHNSLTTPNPNLGPLFEPNSSDDAPPPAFEGFRTGQGKLLTVSKSNMQRAMRMLAEIDGGAPS